MSLESWLLFGSDKTKISATSPSAKPASAEPAAPVRPTTGDPFTDKLIAAAEAATQPATVRAVAASKPTPAFRVSTGDPLKDKLAALGDALENVITNRVRTYDAKVVQTIASNLEIQAQKFATAFKAALEKPEVIFCQPDAGRGLEEGAWRIVVKVPSVLDQGTPYGFDLNKSTAFKYALISLSSYKGLFSTFEDNVIQQLPRIQRDRTIELRKKFAEAGPHIFPKAMRQREIEQWRRQSMKISNIDKEKPLEKPCSVTNLRHPDWYVGFIDDTWIELRGYSNYDDPRGRIVFGSKSGCHRELQISLPWNRFARVKLNSERASFGTAETLHYPIATSFSEGDEVQLDFQKINAVIWELRDLGMAVDPGWIWYFMSGVTDEDWTYKFHGLTAIWNYDLWRCCTEKLGQYGLPSDWHSWDTNCFDGISVVADYRADSSTQPNMNVRITGAKIVLNGWTLADLAEREVPYMTLTPSRFSAPGYLNTEIEAGRLEHLNPTSSDPQQGSGFSSAELLEMASRNPIIRTICQELGQAWSPKYGGVWRRDEQSNEYVLGANNWCSEFFCWSIRTGGSIGVEEIGFQGDISVSVWVKWALWKGRYIDGHSAGWFQLPEIIRPGFGMSVKEQGHASFFLYWTRPPYIYDPGNPWDNRNDPFNEHQFHQSWDKIAAPFDPTAKVNRFRAIGGNQGGGQVTVTNYSIVRVSSEMEAQDWVFADRANRSRPRSEWEKAGMLLWREGTYAAVSPPDVQDGFLQTDDLPYFDVDDRYYHYVKEYLSLRG